MIRNSAHRCSQFAWPWLGAAVLLGVVGSVCCDGVLWAETASPPTTELTPRDLHVWGRFDPGTWKQVRIVTETLNDHGDVADTTTTQTKTTLVRADAKRLTLRIEATVEVAGKRFECQPQIVEYGYYGESPNEPTELKTLGSEPLTIDGQQVPCRIEQVVATTGQQKQVTQMFLSDAVEPFVLKRETAVFKSDGSTPGDPQTTAEVIALDMPYKVLHEIKSTAFERTIQRSTRGTNVTLDVTCVDVPGGIVARTSKELDAQGRLLRRSTLELVDYHVVDDGDDSNNVTDKNGDNSKDSFSRRQARKARKH